MTEPDLQARLPGECADMRQLRAEIERIDRALVKLMAARQRYIERAAELKDKREAVRDEARVADVLGKVLNEAGKYQLASDIAEPVFRMLVERSIALEFKAFDEKNLPEKP